MQVTIYHNPRCSKSRQTLELIRRQGIEPQIVEYLQHPPTREELRRLLGMLGLRAGDLMRRQEEVYRAAGLDADHQEEESLITAMLEHPILIERPVVVAGGRAVLGRPPERVLEIL